MLSGVRSAVFPSNQKTTLPWPRELGSRPNANDWHGHRNRKVRSKQGKPALLVRMEVGRDRPTCSPYGEHVAKPPDHVVPAVCHTNER
jgi:hypothetical protein